ncbi:MAG: LptF/LptG family permease [Pyrinomonadaceae bacterium]
MKRFSPSIARYIFQTTLPYFVFVWLLLSVILFVQQASRYSDIFFNTQIPANLVWQLTAALVPNVIAFTCPMAVLIGVIIGLSKMQGDSELIAVRAAGVGNFQIVVPVVFLGLLLSVFAFSINLKGVPLAAQLARKVALQAALYKLESPIEPGVFNTEIQGFTIYVKSGDIESGTWENIFIYNEDKDTGQARLITSKNGRIDAEGETSELVLGNASVTTFSIAKPYRNFSSEKVENLRFAIKTKRGELVEQIGKTEETPEELGLSELSKYAESKTGKEKTEAYILWQRRIILSITPLLFALLGAALILRFNRGGKGFGIFLALLSLIVYYLLALLGEQLARIETINVFTASLLPVVVTCLAIFWFFLSQRFFLAGTIGGFFKKIDFRRFQNRLKINRRNTLANLTTGILDFDIISDLLKYFFLTVGFLTVVYTIFTAFELWRFAGIIPHGVSLLSKYLIFLVPFVYLQISPSALMVATLATYVIKSRQNEVVVWTASGQSIYRLLFPCFALMMVIGCVNWELQERLLPKTNQIQDTLRAQIKNKGVLAANNGKYWVASENRIYSFNLPDINQPENDRRKVTNLTVYQLASDGIKLQSIFKTDAASWEKGGIRFLSGADKTTWTNDVPQTETIPSSDFVLTENYNPFNQTVEKPNHLNSADTREQLENTASDSERRNFAVALEKKYATPFLPLIVTLFTAPFALSLSRKGRVLTIGYAVGLWLLFTGITSVFEQFGSSGLLLPKIAVWCPLALFAVLGGYLLSRIRT